MSRDPILYVYVEQFIQAILSDKSACVKTAERFISEGTVAANRAKKHIFDCNFCLMFQDSLNIISLKLKY